MEIYSLKEVAQMLNVPPWRISFLFDSGKLQEPPRFAGKRVFLREHIEKITELLGIKNFDVVKASKKCKSF